MEGNSENFETDMKNDGESINWEPFIVSEYLESFMNNAMIEPGHLKVLGLSDLNEFYDTIGLTKGSDAYKKWKLKERLDFQKSLKDYQNNNNGNNESELNKSMSIRIIMDKDESDGITKIKELKSVYDNKDIEYKNELKLMSDKYINDVQMIDRAFNDVIKIVNERREECKENLKVRYEDLKKNDENYYKMLLKQKDTILSCISKFNENLDKYPSDVNKRKPMNMKLINDIINGDNGYMYMKNNKFNSLYKSVELGLNVEYIKPGLNKIGLISDLHNFNINMHIHTKTHDITTNNSNDNIAIIDDDLNDDNSNDDFDDDDEIFGYHANNPSTPGAQTIKVKQLSYNGLPSNTMSPNIRPSMTLANSINDSINHSMIYHEHSESKNNVTKAESSATRTTINSPSDIFLTWNRKRTADNIKFTKNVSQNIDSCELKSVWGNLKQKIVTIYSDNTLINNIKYKSFEYQMQIEIGKECCVGFVQHPISSILGDDNKYYSKSFLHSNNQGKHVYGLTFTKNKFKIGYFIKGSPQKNIKLNKTCKIDKITLIFSFDFQQKTCNVYLNNKTNKISLNEYQPTFVKIPSSIVPVFSHESGNSKVCIKYKRHTNAF